MLRTRFFRVFAGAEENCLSNLESDGLYNGTYILTEDVDVRGSAIEVCDNDISRIAN